MKLELDFKDLESQWKSRQLDLFPWLDGLFALIRSRASLVRETEKRLSSSSPATMVQFLSSDNSDNLRVAKQVIKRQDPSSILHLLLYSLEKVHKTDYPSRVMESLLEFDPVVSLGYLFGYMNLRKGQKDKVFQMIGDIFENFDERFPSIEKREIFLSNVLEALYIDIKEWDKTYGVLEKMEDFDRIALDLRILSLIYKKMSRTDLTGIVERQLQRIGEELIVSLRNLPFDFEDPVELNRQLCEIIPYMILMRLEADEEFLKDLPLKIEKTDLFQEEKDAIIQISEAAIRVIENPDMGIHEILDELETPIPF